MTLDSPWKDVPKKSGIYALLDPDTKKVMYIGQTYSFKKRYADYLANHIKTEFGKKMKWIHDLKMVGKYPELLILEECPREELDDAEIKWIDRYGLKNLLNVTKGGTNAPSLFQISVGKKNTDVSKELITVHLKHIISIYMNRRLKNEMEFWARQYKMSFDDLSNSDQKTDTQKSGVSYYLKCMDMVKKRYYYNMDLSVFDKDELYDMAQCIKTEQTLCNYIIGMIKNNREHKLKNLIYFENKKSHNKYVDFVLNNSYYDCGKDFFLFGGIVRVAGDLRYIKKVDDYGVVWNWGL